jgi:hypothetical protein
MYDLERQMRDQRQQLQHTLDAKEGSARRRSALNILRSAIRNFAGRSPRRSPQKRLSPGPPPMPLPTGAQWPRRPQSKPWLGPGGASGGKGRGWMTI